MAISSRRLSRTEAEAKQAFQRAAWAQRGCAVSGDIQDWADGRKNWEAHHVVEARWLRQYRLSLWDERNALRLRPDVHRKHTNRVEVIELVRLLDVNIEFAFEVMGPAAEEYLGRLYAGTDARIERASALATEQMEREIAALPEGALWTPPHLRTTT